MYRTFQVKDQSTSGSNQLAGAVLRRNGFSGAFDRLNPMKSILDEEHPAVHLVLEIHYPGPRSFLHAGPNKVDHCRCYYVSFTPSSVLNDLQYAKLVFF